VKRHPNRDRSCLQPLLHDSMAASLTDADYSVLFENPAHFQPERTWSLPNRDLDLGYEDVVMDPPGDFRW